MTKCNTLQGCCFIRNNKEANYMSYGIKTGKLKVTDYNHFYELLIENKTFKNYTFLDKIGNYFKLYFDIDLKKKELDHFNVQHSDKLNIHILNTVKKVIEVFKCFWFSRFIDRLIYLFWDF